MVVLRILTQPTCISKLVYSCSRANYPVLLSKTMPLLLSRRTFTLRPTRPPVLVRRQHLNGVLPRRLVRLPKRPHLLARLRIGIVASTSCSRNRRSLHPTVLSLEMFLAQVWRPKPALVRIQVGVSLIPLVHRLAHQRWAVPVLILRRTPSRSWEMEPPPGMSVRRAAATASALRPVVLCLPLLVSLLLFQVVPAVLVLAHQEVPHRLTVPARSLPQLRFGLFAMSALLPPDQHIPISNTTMALALLLQAVVQRVLLRELPHLHPLRLLPKPPLEIAKTDQFPR